MTPSRFVFSREEKTFPLSHFVLAEQCSVRRDEPQTLYEFRSFFISRDTSRSLREVELISWKSESHSTVGSIWITRRSTIELDVSCFVKLMLSTGISFVTINEVGWAGLRFERELTTLWNFVKCSKHGKNLVKPLQLHRLWVDAHRLPWFELWPRKRNRRGGIVWAPLTHADVSLRLLLLCYYARFTWTIDLSLGRWRAKPNSHDPTIRRLWK